MGGTTGGAFTGKSTVYIDEANKVVGKTVNPLGLVKDAA